MKYLFTRPVYIGLLIVAILCQVASRLIGSTVDDAGIQHAPFALIQISGLFLVLGIASAIGALFRPKKGNRTIK